MGRKVTLVWPCEEERRRLRWEKNDRDGRQYLVKEREEGQREDGWIWRGKTWRWLEQGRETKLTESYGEDFRTVATPNRKKRKEKEEFGKRPLGRFCIVFIRIFIFLSRESYQSVITSSLRSCRPSV